MPRPDGRGHLGFARVPRSKDEEVFGDYGGTYGAESVDGVVGSGRQAMDALKRLITYMYSLLWNGYRRVQVLRQWAFFFTIAKSIS